MLKWLYLLASLISIFEFLLFLSQNKERINRNALLLYFFAVITCYGYSMMTFATSVTVIVACYNVYFVGILYSSLLLIFLIAEICNVPFSAFYRRFLLFYSALLIVALATTDQTKLYFSSTTLEKFYGASYLTATFGPLHIFFYIFVGITVISGLLIMIRSIKFKSQVSLKTIIIFMFLLTIHFSFYLVPKVTKFPMEIMSFGYTISLGLLLPISRRMNMYDMTFNILNVFERREDYGYICFDKKLKFMGCSKFAKKVFPSTEKLKIDTPIPNDDLVLNTKILSIIQLWDGLSTEETFIENNGISVLVSVKYLKFREKNIGYLIEIKDNTKQQNYINLINSYNVELSNAVEEQTNKILVIQDSIITGMASMVESRDNSTGGHIYRTSDCIKLFIEKIKESPKYESYSPLFFDNLIKAAPMHDLGKIAINDVILRKPGKFLPEEYNEMKKHSEEGAKIVAKVLSNVDDDFFKSIAINVAHYHHERWDGSGYPEGLKGEEIPLEARIMALPDVFDALVSKRCYKDAFSYDDAFNIISQSLGTHFDPDLGEIFISCRPILETMYNIYYDSSNN